MTVSLQCDNDHTLPKALVTAGTGIIQKVSLQCDDVHGHSKDLVKADLAVSLQCGYLQIAFCEFQIHNLRISKSQICEF